jgi:hypothetical protein
VQVTTLHGRKAIHKGKQVANNASDLTIPHGKPTRRCYKRVLSRKRPHSYKNRTMSNAGAAHDEGHVGQRVMAVLCLQHIQCTYATSSTQHLYCIAGYKVSYEECRKVAKIVIL